jgi:hypothetical protein
MWLASTDVGLPAAGSWCQDRDGNRIWITAVRAAFDVVEQSRLKLSNHQSEPSRVAVHYDDDFTKSLKTEADFFGPRPRTDIVLIGSAWPRGGSRATVVHTRMIVGPIDKQLTVMGDRYFDSGLTRTVTVSDPAPFLHKPIVYEHAFGGWDRSSEDPADHRMLAENPVGKGFRTGLRDILGMPVPGVFAAGQDMRTWTDRPDVAGYGAIACHWQPRAALAGTYDTAWQASRAPLWAVDFQPAYWCAAPRDQQVEGYLRGGERIRLENLSPYGPLDFRLPSIKFDFVTRIRRQKVWREGQIATVLLEPDLPRVTIVWQSTLVCNRDIDYLDETRVSLRRLRREAA